MDGVLRSDGLNRLQTQARLLRRFRGSVRGANFYGRSFSTSVKAAAPSEYGIVVGQEWFC